VPVSVHQGNIGSSADCRRTVAEVIDEHGRLDILVNNAGITIDKTVARMTDEDWHKVLDVNLSGAFFMSQAALAHMVERGSGRIINVSSVNRRDGQHRPGQLRGEQVRAGRVDQDDGQGGAVLPEESGRLTDDTIGITVNTVTPGFIATEMMESIPAKVMDKITAQIPLARLGRPEEIARVVHFLAADASSYITGQVWGVNGGMDM